MITDEQRKQRINYIGSSDAAKVLNLSRWGTPLSVWAEKTGQVEPEDISDELRIKLGNKMEQVVAELFEDETGKKIRRVNETIYHNKYSFLACNLDRRIVGENAILEIKTTSGRNRDQYKEGEFPPETLIQIYHQLAVSGLPKAYACILIGNDELQIKEIERDEKVLGQLVKREVTFWNDFVIPKIMPKVISHKDSDTLFQIFPDSLLAGEAVELGDKGARFIETLKANQADLKVLENVIDQNKNELKAMLGENLMGRTGDWIVTWKTQTTKKLDIDRLKKEAPDLYEQYVKEIPSRVLRLTEIKKGE